MSEQLYALFPLFKYIAIHARDCDVTMQPCPVHIHIGEVTTSRMKREKREKKRRRRRCAALAESHGNRNFDGRNLQRGGRGWWTRTHRGQDSVTTRNQSFIYVLLLENRFNVCSVYIYTASYFYMKKKEKKTGWRDSAAVCLLGIDVSTSYTTK